MLVECSQFRSLKIELLSYASSAYSKYRCHLEKLKEDKEKQVASQKRKAEDDEIAKMKIKRSRLLADASALEKSANEKAEEAEKKGKLPLIAESNALRKRSQEKRAAIEELDKALALKEKKC